MSDQIEQFKIVAELIASAVQTGAVRDLLICDELDWAQSPLKDGAIAERFQRGLSCYLAPRVIAMALQGPPPPTYPNPPVNQRVVLGIDVATDQPLPIALTSVNRHILILGPTGCGKSTLEAIIIKGLLEATP